MSDSLKYIRHARVCFREPVGKPLSDALKDRHDPVPDIRKNFLDIDAESLEKSDNKINPCRNNIFNKIDRVLKGGSNIAEKSVEVAGQ